MKVPTLLVTSNSWIFVYAYLTTAIIVMMNLPMTRSLCFTTTTTCTKKISQTSRAWRTKTNTNSNSNSRLYSSVSSSSSVSKYSYEEKYNQLMHGTTLSLAPMMEYTDRHFRYMMRLLSKDTLLYTEMVAANAICHERQDSLSRGRDIMHAHSPTKGSLLESQVEQDLDTSGYDMTYLRRFLGESRLYTEAGESPPGSILQLGGSDPIQMKEACRAVLELTDRGYCDYTAINLNCGCPSPKVAGKGCFGAALMDEPKLVKSLVTGMHEGADGQIPITVKCRIGTDQGYQFTKSNYEARSDEEEYATLRNFVETVASSGVVSDFQIHARIAVLSKSFSPADNRKVPPLKYHLVRRLVEDYPELTFSLNGGVNTLIEAKEELELCSNMKGVMIGRAMAANPWSFAMADEYLYGDSTSNSGLGSDSGGSSSSSSEKPKNRLEVLEAFGRHADAEEEIWDPVKIRRFIIKAVTPLFAGEPNGKKYRIALDEIAGIPKKRLKEGRGLEDMPPISELILNAAHKTMSEDVLLRSPEESFQRLYGGSTSTASISTSTSRDTTIIQDWQMDRKQQQEEQKQQQQEEMTSQ